MPVNQNIYSRNPFIKQLPIYLVGIGGSEYQGHIRRPDGYYWSQLLYCAGGQGRLLSASGTVPLSEGCFFSLPSNCPHEYYPLTDKWDVRWVVFDGYACPQILQELNLTEPVCIKAKDRTSLEKIYNKMFVAQKTDKIHGDFTCSGLIYEYLLEFHRQVSNTNTGTGAQRSELLMPVLNYIDDHFNEDFPLTVLADIAGILPYVIDLSNTETVISFAAKVKL